MQAETRMKGSGKNVWNQTVWKPRIPLQPIKPGMAVEFSQSLSDRLD